MFSTFAVGALAVLSTPVLCDAASHSNSSTIAYSAPKPSSTVSTTSSHGLGAYIIAALGGTASTSSYNSTGTQYASTIAAVTATNSFTNRSSSTSGPQSTYCYSNVPSKCYTDITYSAVSVDPTGTGSAYASRCSSAKMSYSAVSSSWGAIHTSTYTETQVLGGTTWKDVTYYEDTYTLCDGHARAHSSPAIATSSTVITTTGPATTSYTNATVGYIFPVSSPVCSIGGSDCDALWAGYDYSSSKWAAQDTGNASYPRITASPMAPPCANSSLRVEASSAAAFLTECGPCTIFGEGVQLVYFPVPTTVSRDMCASTPSSPVTWFGEDVVSIYNGSGPPQTVYPPLETATYHNHTFTSGTAYISISSVWIGDRCQASMGTPVTDAILAMPSESVLSLRYRQDHFQYFSKIETVTGYPFNFADMNEPIPYSAYQGQQMCEYQDYIFCDVIYDNNFNPQLAIPPGIRKLRPEWEQCQMWYGGLYDPPMALQPATALATRTLAAVQGTTSAEPSSTTQATTVRATALYASDDSDSGSTTQATDASATGSPNSDDDGSSAAGEADGQAATTVVAGGSNTQSTDNAAADGSVSIASEAHVESSETGLLVGTTTTQQQVVTKSYITTVNSATQGSSSQSSSGESSSNENSNGESSSNENSNGESSSGSSSDGSSSSGSGSDGSSSSGSSSDGSSSDGSSSDGSSSSGSGSDGSSSIGSSSDGSSSDASNNDGSSSDSQNSNSQIASRQSSSGRNIQTSSSSGSGSKTTSATRSSTARSDGSATGTSASVATASNSAASSYTSSPGVWASLVSVLLFFAHT